MRRRKRILIKRIILVLILLALIGAGVWGFMWWSGKLLPSWWKDRLEAEDGGGTEVVESVVLKDKTLVVYSAGNEIYRSPSDLKVQDVIWHDINGDGIREIVMLAWARGLDGMQVEGLTGDGSIGYSQHLYVFDGARTGMNELFVSAPLLMEVKSMRIDEKERLIIEEPLGKMTLWAFGGVTFVPAR